MKTQWAASEELIRARKSAPGPLVVRIALVCLVCLLNGLSAGCSSTDVGASNYRCMDDDDCRTGLICHPVQAANLRSSLMGVCRATAEWLRMPVLPALVAGNLWACGRASPVARPTQVEHLAAMAFAAGAKRMWTVVVLIVVDAKRDSCASNLRCLSTVCDNNRCTEASCSDGVLNGSETSTDCGGSCSGVGVGSVCSGN